MIGRRPMLAGVALAVLGGGAAAKGSMMEDQVLYGLIGKMKAQPGKRAALIAILAEGTEAMPGCLAYIVAEDLGDPDGIWISEVWDSKASHAASLQLASVREAIAKGRPLIAGFESHVETRPVSGVPGA